MNWLFALLVASSVLAASSTARGAAGDVLWTTDDVSADLFIPVSTAADSKRFYAAGNVGSYQASWAIKSFDTKAGVLLWSDLVDLSPTHYVTVEDIAVRGGRVAAVGTSTPRPCPDPCYVDKSFVRMLDAKTGTLL